MNTPTRLPTLAERKRAAREAGPTTLGSFLYAHRRNARETLAVVASRLGITVGFLSSIERNEKEPSDLVLDEIIRVYEIKAGWVYALAGRTTGPVRELLRREPNLGLLLADLATLESADVLVPLLQRMVDGALRREESDRARAAEAAPPGRRRKTG